jgi:cytochrome c oxidase subunit 4
MSHISSNRLLWTIFGTLIAMTILTVVAARMDFGVMGTPIALAIAGFKASLVILYFMGVRYNTPLTKVVAATGFLWLLILFGITMGDYLTRSWIGFPGR